MLKMILFLPEVVGMHHPAREPLDPREGWHVGSGIVAGCHHHIVESTIGGQTDLPLLWCVMDHPTN